MHQGDVKTIFLEQKTCIKKRAARNSLKQNRNV